jgi:cytoskeletal protein RodZ
MTSRQIQLLPRDLVEWREAKGISLRQIIETTKISPRYLEAIEPGDFHKLPGGIYSESYIRQYALAIGDFDNVLLDYYHSIFVEDCPTADVTGRRWWD